jgi:uncharacterized protein (PEP-CTERM system associated)
MATTRASAWRAAAAFLALSALPAGAADWTFAPDITLRETYTDNAFLGSGGKRHDWVTDVSPGIRIDGRGARLTASLAYRPSAIFYARESDGNDIANNLQAFGRLEAIERFFFVEAAGNIAQNFISPFAAQPTDLAVSTPNRIESRTVSLSPYVAGEIARTLAYELRNGNTWTSTNDASLGDIHSIQWTGRVSRPVRVFGWALDYSDTEIRHEDFAGRPDEESRLYRGIVYFQPTPEWRLSASAGREENNFILQEEQRYSMRGGGISWRPGPRTSASFDYERRYFGPSRIARFDHRTRLTAWNLAYSRSASNFQEEVLRLPPGNTAALLDAIFTARISDPVERAAAVQQFLQSTGTPAFLATPLSFYTQRIFVREAVDASFGIVGVRNSITFTAFYAENTGLTGTASTVAPDTFLLADRFNQRGFGARADHRLTAFTSLGAQATRVYSRQHEPLPLDTRNDNFAVTLNHTVSPRTTTFAGVSATRFQSGESGTSDQDANSVFVGLNHRF